MPKLIKSESSLDLTHDEQRDRLALERKVEQAFYIAGLSLAQLRDRRLYRSTHSSFERGGRCFVSSLSNRNRSLPPSKAIIKMPHSR
jgi:hypothetical protein